MYWAAALSRIVRPTSPSTIVCPTITRQVAAAVLHEPFLFIYSGFPNCVSSIFFLFPTATPLPIRELSSGRSWGRIYWNGSRRGKLIQSERFSVRRLSYPSFFGRGKFTCSILPFGCRYERARMLVRIFIVIRQGCCCFFSQIGCQFVAIYYQPLKHILRGIPKNAISMLILEKRSITRCVWKYDGLWFFWKENCFNDYKLQNFSHVDLYPDTNISSGVGRAVYVVELFHSCSSCALPRWTSNEML